MTNRPLGIVLALFLALGASEKVCRSESLSWERVSAEIGKEVALSQEEASKVYKQIEKERKALLEEVSSLKERAGLLGSEVEQLKREFEELRSGEERFRREILEQHNEVSEIQKHIFSWRDDLSGLFEKSPLVIYHNGLKSLRDRFDDPEYTVTMEDIRSLVEALFTEITLGGVVEKVNLPVYGDDGKQRSLKVLRVGTFCIFALSGNHVRLVRLGPDNSFLFSSYSLPGKAGRIVKAYFEGSGKAVPVDISGNKAYEAGSAAAGNRLVEWFKSGGIVMWPLLLIALISTGICIERAWFYRKQKPLSEEVWARILETLRLGKWDLCKELCQGFRFSPAARTIREVVSAYSNHLSKNPGNGLVRVEDLVDEALFKEIGYLHRFLSTLSTMASVAPLLGLLGTVCGIIETFQVITIVGTGNPRYLSSGISEALITTQFGLMIAIPVVIAHHFLERWAERLTAEAEEKSSQVCGILTELNHRERGHE